MTSAMYQYKSQQQQETPGQVVTIGNVDVQHKNAEAQPLNGGGNLVINLAVFNGPILVWPNSGEQWIVKMVKGQWVLAERTYISAQAYLVDAVPGDQVWDVQGNIVENVKGNSITTVAGNISTVADGTITIVDQNGSLSTAPTPVWTPVTYQNSWTDYAHTYPTVEFIVDGNTVHFRGVMGPGLTTDGTTPFTIPTQFGCPVAQQVFLIAPVLGAPNAPGLRLIGYGSGVFDIYGTGSCIAMSLDNVSYFYKY